jgi:hypothetical protein
MQSCTTVQHARIVSLHQLIGVQRSSGSVEGGFRDVCVAWRRLCVHALTGRCGRCGCWRCLCFSMDKGCKYLNAIVVNPS